MARGLKLQQNWEDHYPDIGLQTKRPVTAYFDVFAVIAKNSTY
jgi:hypothetical protein